MRAVLAIPAFRRLWLVTSIAGVCDWLSLLALSALATQLTSGYQAQSFALGGVVATRLLPPLLLGPVAGALADKFDRRRVMVVCDLLRCALFVSIPLVGTLWWLLVATLLIEMCAMFWIPAKDAAVPNLLRRPDQMETAGQLALVMTYGVSVITASGLFALLSRGGAILGASALDTVYVAVLLSGAAYLVTALTVLLRIPEISGRSGTRRAAAPGLLALIRDGAAFVARTPLVRGLVIGIIGAFAAGGIVIGSATLYAQSLGGGNAAYGVLFASVFIGLALGMGAAPRMARRIPHNRLFGAAIVAAGLALVLVALAPHLFLAIAAVMLVGGFAGIAFLTGLTIIGTQVADEIRGRVNAFVQTIVRLTLLGSLSVVPVIVGLVASRTSARSRSTAPGWSCSRAASSRRPSAPSPTARWTTDAPPRCCPTCSPRCAGASPARARGCWWRSRASAPRRPPSRPLGWPPGCAPTATPSLRSRAAPRIASGGRQRCGKRRCPARARGRWRPRRSWPTRSNA